MHEQKADCLTAHHCLPGFGCIAGLCIEDCIVLCCVVYKAFIKVLSFYFFSCLVFLCIICTYGF